MDGFSVPLVVLTLLGCLLSVAQGVERSAADWVRVIRTEAAGATDSGLEELRLAAGVYLTPGTAAATTADSQFPDSAAALRTFMQERGAAILDRIRSGETLSAADEPYRLIVLTCWMRIVYDADKAVSRGKTPSHDLYLSDILPTDALSLYDAAAEGAALVDLARDDLRSAYLGATLTDTQIARLRRLRMLQGARSVGESFLPCHLGLNPHDARPVYSWRAARVESLVGAPAFDLRLPTLAAVRQRVTYREDHDRAYGFRFPARPEGVLELLEPVTGYQAGAVIGGNETVDAVPVNDAGESETLSQIGPGRPLFLLANDAVDHPLPRGFGLTPVALRAWHEAADFRFVQTNIHDWYFASRFYEDYFDSRVGYENAHHAWSEEERARRISMRLVQYPQCDVVPVLVDNLAQQFKDRYGATGGTNTFWLLDRDNTAAFTADNSFDQPMISFNQTEAALADLLDSGGVGVTNGDYRHCEKPADPLLVVRATIDGVQASTLSVSGAAGDFEVTFSDHARVEGADVAAGLGLFAVGDAVVLWCRFSDLGQSGPWSWPGSDGDPTASTIGGSACTVQSAQSVHGDQRFVELLGGLTGVELVAVRMDHDHGDGNKRLLEPTWDDMWRGGMVRAIDASAQTITIDPWPYRSDLVNGHSILADWQQRGLAFTLEPDSMARHERIAAWLGGTGADTVFSVDDAVPVTLNGRYTAAFADLRVGDRVTLRYNLDAPLDGTVAATMLRITRHAALVGSRTITIGAGPGGPAWEVVEPLDGPAGIVDGDITRFENVIPWLPTVLQPVPAAPEGSG